MSRYSAMAASRQRQRLGGLRRKLAMPALGVAVAISAAVVLVATAQTSSARFQATTSNEGNLFTSAVVSIDVESETVTERQAELFLDGTGLSPGRAIENCLQVIDQSSVENVDARLFVATLEGELGQYFEFTVSLADMEDGRCGGEANAELLFSGTLAEFASLHDSYATGLLLPQRAGTGGGDMALLVTGSLVNDNAAQGLSVAYDVLLEARPA